LFNGNCVFFIFGVLYRNIHELSRKNNGILSVNAIFFIREVPGLYSLPVYKLYQFYVLKYTYRSVTFDYSIGAAIKLAPIKN
jgi:hypothetical protein